MNTIQLDYSLDTPELRKQLVEQIISQTPEEKLTAYYLDILATYILDACDKGEKKSKFSTQNRMKTVNAHETSYEGLVGKFENGEDGLYNMTIENDKNIIFAPKKPITDEDAESIPALKQLREDIKVMEARCKAATGKKAFLLRRQLIQMYQDQYVIRNAYQPTGYTQNYTKSLSRVDLAGTEAWDGTTITSTSLINLFNESHISALLCNYSRIKEDTYADFGNDMHWMMEDLDDCIEEALATNPAYKEILIRKIDGETNESIQLLLKEKFGKTYSIEHISHVWRKLIPALIKEAAIDRWLDFHFLQEEKGYYKRCSKCGQIKLGIPRYFSKNNTSKDKLYSICKKCRSAGSPSPA